MAESVELQNQAYALAFSSGLGSPSDLKLAVGSFETRAANNVTVLRSSGHSGEESNCSFTPVASIAHSYPATKVSFAPASLRQGLSQGHDLLASTSDALRLWDCNDQDSRNASLAPRCVLMNPAKSDFTAPLTSFAWSSVEPSLILTSSTNTTVTLWDVVSQVAVTQLIAHDREVYDVAWQPAALGPTGQREGGRDIFASCGADGSVRLFDVRSLEHSTILYEASTPVTSPKLSSSSLHSSPVTSQSPLLKIAFDPNNPTSLAAVHDGSPSILLIDIRQPGIPVAEFKAHQAAVNGLVWTNNLKGTEGSCLATVADDGLALVWDGSAAFTGAMGKVEQNRNGSTPSGSGKKGNAVQTRIVRDPVLAYEAGGEINSVAVGSAGGKEFLACSVGKSVRVLRI